MQRDLSPAKTGPPDVAAFAIQRVRLLDRLDEVLTDRRPRMLLVSAPAGFGKSTLLADWSARSPEGTVVAWCSLDTTDATPYRFWGLVLGALDAAGAGMSGAPPRRAGSVFPDRLADHLGSRPGLVLVLDNLQQVRDGALADDVVRLVDRVAGRGRVVLLTRRDPATPTLQRHRLAGHLAELRTADLAFTREETALLCPDVDPARVEAGWRASEGWPAVLRLFDMAWRAQDPATTSGPHVEDDTALADYLFDETLAAQPAETQRLLMLAAVPVLLPVDLAVELTGRADVGEHLDQVAHATGLVTRYGGGRAGVPSYRFHPILRSHLRGRLLLEDLPGACRADAVAAAHFMRAGLTAQAVEHAVRSGDPVVLEDVLAECGAGLITGGEADLLASVLRETLAGTAGHGPAIVPATRGWPGPWAHAALAAAELDRGAVVEAAAVLARARSLAPHEDEDGQGGRALSVLLSAAEVHLRRRRGEPSPESALTLDPPEPIHPELRLLLAVQRGTALMWRGDWDAAERELEVGLDLARGLGRDAAVIDCLTGLGCVHAARSSVPATRERVDEALWLARARGWEDTSRVAFTHVLAAWAAWQELRPVQAREHMDAALAVLDLGADPTIVGAARALDAVLEHEAEHTPESAQRLHAVWSALESREAAPSLIAYAVLADTRFSLGLHRIGWAHDALDVARRRLPDSGEVQLVDALVSESSGQVSRARQLVEAVASGRTPTAVPSTVIEAHSTSARLALQDGDTTRAVDHTRSALGLVAELGCVRPVTDAGGPEVVGLLRSERGRWGALEGVVDVVLERSDQGAYVPAVQLTGREGDILRELPSLRTVEEIGDLLFLSPNTVKTHLRGIYRKLEVTSRREAVIEARRVGLL